MTENRHKRDKRRRDGGPLQLVGFRADRLVVAQLRLLAKARGQTLSQWLRASATAHFARQIQGVE